MELCTYAASLSIVILSTSTLPTTHGFQVHTLRSRTSFGTDQLPPRKMGYLDDLTPNSSDGRSTGKESRWGKWKPRGSDEQRNVFEGASTSGPSVNNVNDDIASSVVYDSITTGNTQSERHHNTFSQGNDTGISTTTMIKTVVNDTVRDMFDSIVDDLTDQYLEFQDYIAESSPSDDAIDWVIPTKAQEEEDEFDHTTDVDSGIIHGGVTNELSSAKLRDEKVNAERVITARTRNAVLKLAQEEHVTAENGEAVRLTAMRKTDEEARLAAEKANAERVITSRTRMAIIKLAQEESLMTMDLEALRLAAMRKTDEELSLVALKRDAERVITSRVRDAVLKLAQEENVTGKKGEEMRLAAMMKTDEELSLVGLKRDADRVITSRVRDAVLKLAQEENVTAKKGEEMRLAAMMRTDEERLEAERVITSRARDAVLKLAQGKYLTAEEGEEMRHAAMMRTEAEIRLAAEKSAAERVITSRTRDAILKLALQYHLTADCVTDTVLSTKPNESKAQFGHTAHEYSGMAFGTYADRLSSAKSREENERTDTIITSRTQKAILKLAQEEHLTAERLEAVRLTAMSKMGEEECFEAERARSERIVSASNS
eukprot:CAMPEP_0172518560 /NCGR_PEP_ID=MMETSP1066-20121228/290895_1 /TAXON_ID=671091 /ORGANISM="Coscinodiscus wailesii, Strain CCMP2513" /LENGTH=600 /DNA_ID=CAMNT_0013300979 /DNA_START=106 /DNA_END=1908 /DNA_ORIENTATION=-